MGLGVLVSFYVWIIRFLLFFLGLVFNNFKYCSYFVVLWKLLLIDFIKLCFYFRDFKEVFFLKYLYKDGKISIKF